VRHSTVMNLERCKPLIHSTNTVALIATPNTSRIHGELAAALRRSRGVIPRRHWSIVGWTWRTCASDQPYARVSLACSKYMNTVTQTCEFAKQKFERQHDTNHPSNDMVSWAHELLRVGVAVASALHLGAALDNGAAPRPPLGWQSWNG
jgi:hypothetical protein